MKIIDIQPAIKIETVNSEILYIGANDLIQITDYEQNIYIGLFLRMSFVKNLGNIIVINTDGFIRQIQISEISEIKILKRGI